MKAILTILALFIAANSATAQNDMDSIVLEGCWTMKEEITSSGDYQQYGTYLIRIDSLNNVWKQSGDTEIRKSGLIIKGRQAFFSWPYREKFNVINNSDTSFTLIRYINHTIPEGEYSEMPYPRGPQSTSTTVKYLFYKRECE